MAKHRVNIAFAVMLSWLLSGPGALAGTFQVGIKHYNAGRYRHAVIFLSAAAAQQPHDSLVHYYLANALVHQGRHDDAVVEYNLSFQLDPRGPVAGFCLEALEKYGQPIRELEKTQVQLTETYRRLHTVGDLAARSGGANSEVSRAVSLIRQQAAYEKAKHRYYNEYMVKAVMEQAATQKGRIRQWRDDEISVLQQPVIIAGGRGAIDLRYVNPALFDPQMREAMIKRVEQQAHEKEKACEARAAEHVDRHKRWLAEKNYALDDVVSNLESQLESPGKGSVRLVPEGTGLYVRQYAHSRSGRELPEVRQAVVRIVGQGADEAHDYQHGWGGQQASKRVTGKVLESD